MWAQRAGDAGIDYPNALAVSGINMCVAGAFNSATAAFGTQNLVSVAPVPAGFFATLNDATNLAVATPTTLAGLELYPNPAGRVARVTLLTGLGSATLMLLDAVGRVVRTLALQRVSPICSAWWASHPASMPYGCGWARHRQPRSCW